MQFSVIHEQGTLVGDVVRTPAKDLPADACCPACSSKGMLLCRSAVEHPRLVGGKGTSTWMACDTCDWQSRAVCTAVPFTPPTPAPPKETSP